MSPGESGVPDIFYYDSFPTWIHFCLLFFLIFAPWFIVYYLYSAQLSKIFRPGMTEKRLGMANKDKHGRPEWTCFCAALVYPTNLIEGHGYLSWWCDVKSTRKHSYLERKFGWNICDMCTTFEKTVFIEQHLGYFSLLLILVSLILFLVFWYQRK